jgi:DNA-binding transcriptional ArsR family regulator
MQNDVFVAIADTTRREIIGLLAKQKVPVQLLAEHFPISRPAISRHLKILRQAGLVSEQKKGRQRLYQLHPERLSEVRGWIMYFDQFWFDSLNKLKNLVEENANDPNTAD